MPKKVSDTDIQSVKRRVETLLLSFQGVEIAEVLTILSHAYVLACKQCNVTKLQAREGIDILLEAIL